MIFYIYVLKNYFKVRNKDFIYINNKTLEINNFPKSYEI